MKHKIFALLLIPLLCCYLAKAQDDNWAFDPYEFQYDMTAYVGLNVDGNKVDDLARYKVGAFCGDECRGIMEVKKAADADNSQTLQYGYLRIRSNKESGEQITFKVYDTTTGASLKCEDTLLFTADAVQGVPSSPMMLSAANKYKVDYVAFDQVIATEEVYYGEAVPSIEAPEKEGYTFAGWTTLPETMPAHDLTVTGSYTINSYTLTFKVGDEVISESVVEFGSKIEEPAAPTKDGYTFAGWEEHPETMPAYDLVINGHYEGNSYKLTYIIDGEVVSEFEVEIGTALTAIEAPEKEGYTFNGWEGLPETMPAQDVTVTGSYTINSYTLVFKIDDEVLSETTVEYGSEIVAPEVSEKEGYTFSGWSEYPETMPAQNLTVTGSYTINSYTLVFKIDDEVLSETTVEYGSEIVAPEVPEKEGYTFNGWEGLPETMPAQDVTVTGSYTINSYTLVFKIDDEVLSETTVEYGSEIVAPEVSEKEGYTFSGWSEYPETMPAKDLVITGSYTINSYTLVFKIDDEVLSEATVEYGSEIVAPEVPEKEGYTFSGWGEYPETMPAKDLVIIGSYNINSYKLTYVIDGEVIEESEIEYGSTLTAKEAPEKEGYTFNGWVGLPEVMPAQELTVTGSYTINTYTLVFKIDGEVLSEATVEYGSEIVAPEVPEKEGYTFSGWSEYPETMPAQDVTITGSYIVNTYILVFKIDEDVLSEATVEYGSEIVTPEVPEKEGYTFSGWSEYPETMPAQDLIVTGSYTINSYKLTYVIDGEVIEESEVEYGSTLTAKEAPEKEGYTFNGWVGLPEVMPAQDLTVTGSYTINSYTLTFKVGNDVISESVVEYGSKIEEPAAPIKEGYTFAGWEEHPETMPAYDLVVNGHYEGNSYKLTYTIDGEVVSELEVEIGTVLTAIDAPEKEGYTFNGWVGLPEVMPAQDVTVTGSYTINSYTLVFKIDDEVLSETTLEYGSEIVAPEVLEKEGYTFSGWGAYPETMPASDLVITGSYIANVYTVTYMIDDEVIRVDVVEYGQVLPEAPEAPEKEGYTFSGWSQYPETMPAKDLIITGSYTVNVYTVTYMIDDEVIRVDDVEYGQILPEAPEAPEKEDYEFAGWSEIPSTMPAHDIVVVGTYEYSAGLNSILTDSLQVDIFDLQGRLIKRSADLDKLSELVPPGLYIIKGKKVLVK